MLNVNVSTKIFGDRETQPPIPEVKLRLVSETLSAREIITQAVEKQINALLKEHTSDFSRVKRQLARQYLEQSEVEAQAQVGKVAFENKKNAELSGPDTEKEIRRAIKAFKNGGYKMFVDGSEVFELDEKCLVREGSNVHFLRLIPLVGG